MSRPLVALAGNPNTGKTTLFNTLTGSNARVGNYPGVTVDIAQGSCRFGDTDCDVVDVPGAYSLVARSEEERIAIELLLGLRDGRRPDVVVICADATNLARNLYLVLQCQELGLNVVLALTMMDEARAILPDPQVLGPLLHCSIQPTVPRNGEGVGELKGLVAHALTHPVEGPRWRWTPSAALKSRMEAVELPASWPRSDGLALWQLMSTDSGDTAVDDEAVLARWRWLDAEITPLLQAPPDRSATERVDAVLLHPVAGLAAFLGVMFVVFQALFAWSDPAITAVESLFSWVGDQVASLLPAGLVNDFLVEAVIGGVGSVVVFLPQILLLFFFIGLMEDSGYMARVAYLMDRVMRAMGLHGRAFVPMLSGFACAVPAILATRTLERQRDRVLTMMVIPLMSCSARLPVYTLIIGALFDGDARLMVAMYAFSTLMSLGAALVLSRTVLPAPPTSLLMELPPYRLPRVVDVLRMMWIRTRAFLEEAGTVIFVATAILWGLLSFPKVDVDPTLGAEAQAGQQLRGSYAGQFGQVIEPAIAPLGFDWKIGVGLVGAFAAREVFVSTMAVVYNVSDEATEEDATLRERMKAEKRADGSPLWSPLTGMSLMAFFALACQCLSTLAVVKRETRGWKWPTFLLAYMTALAWTVSFVIYQGGRLIGLD